MPRYYFDINDGEHFDRDETGVEACGLEEAQAQAVSILPDVAREVLPDGGYREISVLLRDSIGKSVFRAMLTLRCIALDGGTERPNDDAG